MPPRSYAAGHFLLRLDGDDRAPAFLRSVTGGNLHAAVVDEPGGAADVRPRRLGAAAIEPIAFEVGIAMARPLLGWIRDSWRRRPSRRDGAVIHADARCAARLEHGFHQALITETRFPTLDGAAREPAYLGCSVLPEWVELRPGDGERLRATLEPDQKRWTPSSFRLELDGLDGRWVSRIDGFAVRQLVRPLATGRDRIAALEPVGIGFPEVSVYLAAEHAGGFVAWHRDAVQRGARDARRDGAIEFLSPDRRSVLMTIELRRTAIMNLAIETCEAGAEQIKRVKVVLAVEGMDLGIG